MSDIPQSFKETMGACPNCQDAYLAQNVRLLSKADGKTYMHLSCSGCLQMMIFCIVRQGRKALCAGMMTDCTYEDAQRLHDAEIVTFRDVMRVHDDISDGFIQGLSESA